MSEKSDLDTLLGPDRRRTPRPTGLGGIMLVITVLVALGFVLFWPDSAPDL